MALSWVVVCGAKYLVLPYIAGLWAFGVYDSEIATPWTLGWLLLWMAFGPLAGIVGAWLWTAAPVWSALGILGVVLAVPYYPQAFTVLATLFWAFFFCAPFVWIPLAGFILITTVIYYWSTGGLGL